MRKYLNEEHRNMFDRYFKLALTGGCDGRQAESIAKERTLYRIMLASAAIANMRSQISGNIVRETPAPRHRDGVVAD